MDHDPALPGTSLSSNEVTMPPKNFGGITDSRKYAPEKIWCNSRFSYAPQNIYSLPNFVSSAMPPKDLAPFSIYTRQKTIF